MNVDMGKRIYKIVACKNCGHLQITFAEHSCKCFRCNANIDIDSSAVIFRTNNPSKAREKLLILKSTKPAEFKKLK